MTGSDYVWHADRRTDAGEVIVRCSEQEGGSGDNGMLLVFALTCCDCVTM